MISLVIFCHPETLEAFLIFSQQPARLASFLARKFVKQVVHGYPSYRRTRYPDAFEIPGFWVALAAPACPE